jgi:hypothetical protein
VLDDLQNSFTKTGLLHTTQLGLVSMEEPSVFANNGVSHFH